MLAQVMTEADSKHLVYYAIDSVDPGGPYLDFPLIDLTDRSQCQHSLTNFRFHMEGIDRHP